MDGNVFQLQERWSHDNCSVLQKPKLTSICPPKEEAFILSTICLWESNERRLGSRVRQKNDDTLRLLSAWSQIHPIIPYC